VVVLFNPRKNKQSFVLNTSKKTISSLAFSGDGKYLATGEVSITLQIRNACGWSIRIVLKYSTVNVHV